jgi:hypothetical protein
MQTRSKMVAEARLFLKLGSLSFLGLAFYYGQLFFGMVNNVFMFKAVAITFLLVTLPLPVIAFNNKKLFPSIRGASKKMLNWITILLFMHHFLMTFMFVMILKEGRLTGL